MKHYARGASADLTMGIDILVDIWIKGEGGYPSFE